MNVPRVSIVVVNYNGVQHLAPCFSSLLRQTYAADAIEIILVDNASHDGSVELVQSHYPQVKLIQNLDNRGFVAAVNQGAMAATGEYLALINNDAYADPRWIEHMVATLQEHRDSGVVCVAAHMQDWFGRTIDFITGGINYYGHGLQLYKHLPVETVDPTHHELLFACGGAMLVDRHIFLDVGGFDEDYFAYFEDVDFGWRLWVLGYKVLLAPDAIVHHRQHGTANRMYYHQVQMLSERNALWTIMKNYDDHHLRTVLPAALMLMVRRSLDDLQAERYRPNFDIRERSATPEAAMVVPKVAISKLMAIGDVLERLDQGWRKRMAIQDRRKRSDAEILTLFRVPMYPSYHSTAYMHAQEQLTRVFGIADLFAATRFQQVLIVSAAPLAVDSRLLQMADYLAQHCHVTLAAPAVQGQAPKHVTVVRYAAGQTAVVQQLLDHTEIAIIDLATFNQKLTFRPMMLIVDADQAQPPADETSEAESYFAAVDVVLCENNMQRAAWLEWLEQTGRVSTALRQQDPSLRQLVDVVSFPSAIEPLRAIERNKWHTREFGSTNYQTETKTDHSSTHDLITKLADYETQIDQKNAHIAKLESLIRQLEQGRIMRGLRLLNKLRG